MRDLKFRAWNKNRKEMVYFPKLEWMLISGKLSIECISSSYESLIDNPKWWENLSKLMQFTGLKDKNGKEIYDGDIIIMHDFGMDGIRAQIIWNERECGWHYLPISGTDYARQLLAPITDNKGKQHKGHVIEIIGNIYENPKLLK